MAILGVGPVCAVALVSLAVPMFAPRTVYGYGPYTILLACLGGLSISRLWQVRLPVFAALITVSVLGLLHDRPSPTDYAGLAQEITQEQRSDDVWFVQRHYFLTPLFYHLRAEEQRFIGSDYGNALEQHPRSRVWVVGLEKLELPSQMLEPLRKYQHAGRIAKRGIYADLYVTTTETTHSDRPLSSASGQKGG
jgi:hypothetical protein